jgi:hypothetical protein
LILLGFFPNLDAIHDFSESRAEGEVIHSS